MAVESNIPVKATLKSRFKPTEKEGYLAYGALLLGFLFIRWLLFSFSGVGVTVFVALFVAISYIAFKDVEKFDRKNAQIWFGFLMLLGISYALYRNTVLDPFKNLIMIFTASYAVLSISGNRFENRIGVWLLFDLFNSLIRLPFWNFALIFLGIRGGKRRDVKQNRNVIQVFVGILIGIFLLVIILPILMRIDAGGFSDMFSWLYNLQIWHQFSFEYNLTILIMSLPVSAYFYGLFMGCRHFDTWHADSIEFKMDQVRCIQKMSPITLEIVAGMLLVVYGIFTFTQLPYYLSAMKGMLPDGAMSYAAYARRGFFELVQITVFNLIFIIIGAILVKKDEVKAGHAIILKTMSHVLCITTLFFIITAFSKMFLYIQVYGLTLRRFMPCVFMLWLFIVICLIIWKSLKSIRLSFTIGGIFLVMIALVNTPDMMSHYNAERYLEGSLDHFDIAVLKEAGSSGVDTALMLMAQTGEEENIHREMRLYLLSEKERIEGQSDRMFLTMADWIAKEKIAKITD
ncbi:MAG: DUF4173 domain-containing protein [Clostridia bacterium]|nr:DUF4173 domain-containing protein [Clostridia bacterium]